MRRAFPLLLFAASCRPAQNAPPQEPPVKKTHTNRLAKEKSPYLLQHAHNPVDWFPWGEEAFAEARKRDKPIFLSIGYSTCHWCHVMERESFESEEIAALMNEKFVCVKVDREERPDVDHLYMTAVQAMEQGGGWPLSVWLTPDRTPFFGGTYFPPDHFKAIISRIDEIWRTKREEIEKSGREILKHLEETSRSFAGGRIGAEALEKACSQLESQFDSEFGGFGRGRNKFPSPPLMFFLLRYGKGRALEMTEKTLQCMAAGGIYDLLGGGFARYSTDREWLVPHFEKMLYDNAQLMRLYVEAFQVTGKRAYADVARDIARYVMRDLLSPDGAFYSAEDADSEGIEGKFYVWRPEEVKAVLGEKDGAIFCRLYDVTNEGNWTPHEADLPKDRSILHPHLTPEQVSKLEKRPVEEIRRIDVEGRKKLFEAREKRVRPHRDDKVITSWNGLMIGALAYSGRALGEPGYVAAAERAVGFVLKHLEKDGRLLRRWREGEAKFLGNLEDYAFLVEALIDLYEATFKAEYLEQARRLTERMIELFEDPAGGFFITGKDEKEVAVRLKDEHDGVIPTGNSVAALDLLRLAEFYGDENYVKRAEGTFASLSKMIEGYPVALPTMLVAVDMALGPRREIVLAGDGPLVDAVRKKFLPRTVIASSATKLPITEGKGLIEGRPAAYVCWNRACRLPVTKVEELEEQLK